MVTEPTISRKQAWCKLAILIAEELPTPREINFQPDNSSIYIQFDTDMALQAWAEYFGMPLDTSHQAPDGDWIHGASTTSGRPWHGFYVRLTAYTRGEPTPAPVAEDMAAVAAEGADR